MSFGEAPEVLTFSPPVSRKQRNEVRGQAHIWAQEDPAIDPLPAVNRYLGSLGLRPVTSDATSLLEALYCLSATHVLFGANQDANLERIGRLEAEKEVLQQRVKQLSLAFDATEREAAQKEDKLRSALSMASAQHRALEAEKAEMAKEMAALQHRDNQYLHETRKKEREMEKLQKKLQSALSERGVKDTRGIELNVPRAPAANKVPLTETDLQRRTIRSLEERTAALCAENDALRTALQEFSERASVAEPAAASQLDVVPPTLRLPLDSTDGLQHLRSQIWQRIDQLRVNLSSMEQGNEEIGLTSLQQQVNELRRIVAEQEQLLLFSLGTSESASSITSKEREREQERDVWPSPILRTNIHGTPGRSEEKRIVRAPRAPRLVDQENRLPQSRV